MKRKRTKELKRKVIITILIISIMVPVFSIFSIQSFASSDYSSYFLGEYKAYNPIPIEEETNTVKNEDGSFSNPISDGDAAITFIIPGFGSQADNWSNDYENYSDPTDRNVKLQLSYNYKSLVEKLRHAANAKVYYARCKSEYTKISEDGKYVLPGETLKKHNFELFELYDICECETSSEECRCIIPYGIPDKTTAANEVGSNYKLVDTISDISQHMVVLFDPAYSCSSNDIIYGQLNYIIDRIVYDVKYWNSNQLPKINIITHSRGGIIGMQYALDHPYLVDSLVTIAAPFNGTLLGTNEKTMGVVGLNTGIPGVADIMNESVYEGYKNEWNSNYSQKYSGINFCAIGGYSNVDFLYELISEDVMFDAFFNSSDSENSDKARLLKAIKKIAEFIAKGWNLEKILLNDELLNLLSDYTEGDISEIIQIVNEITYADCSSAYEEYIVADDLFVNLDSQLATGYTGVNQYTRKFTAGNYDSSMRAQKEVAIIHNLEPGDAEIHNTIRFLINMGAADLVNDENYNAVLKSDGTYKIIGLKQSSNITSLAIPSYFNEVPVSEIGYAAFRGNENVVSVIIPPTVEVIGTEAFSGCINLTSVSFENGSSLEIVGREAFSGCASLSSISLPSTTYTIGKLCFANCNLTSFNVGENVSAFGLNAFEGNPLTAFSVSSESQTFCSENGVIYTKDMSQLVSYPTGNTATSYVVNSATESIGMYAFSGNDYLENVELANCQAVEKCAFYGCESLIQIEGDSLIDIGEDAITNTALDDIETGSIVVGCILYEVRGDAESINLSGCTTIGENALTGKNNLKELYIDYPVVFVSSNAISDCSELETVYISNCASDIYFSENSLSNLPKLKNIYVPESKLDYYKTMAALANYIGIISTHQTTIHYDSAGGNEVSDSSINYGGALDINQFPTVSRIGYNLIEWTCVDNGEEINLYEMEEWSSFSDEVTFVADWSPITYRIMYYLSNSSSYNSYVEYTIESDTFSLYSPTKKGYSFSGWYDNPEFEGSAITVIENGSYGDKQLYAKWTPNTYQITLKYDDGNNINYFTAQVTYGEMFILPVPEREGYYFNAWRYKNIDYTDGNGYSKLYWNIASSVELVAIWTKEYYYINVNENGNCTWLNEESDTYNPIEYGHVFESINDLKNSFMNHNMGFEIGYYINGFDICVVANGINYFRRNISLDDADTWANLTLNAGNYCIYATYSKEQYTLNFEGCSPDTVTFGYAEDLSFPQVSKQGYIFEYWKVKDVTENQLYNGTEYSIGKIFNYSQMPDISPTFGIDDILTIYLQPVFSPIEVSVMYETYSESTLSDSKISYDTLSGDFNFPVPEKSGYDFIGWYDGVNGTGTKYSNSSGVLIRTWNKLTSTKLYAKWTPTEYTITYVLNGGSFEESYPDSYNVEQISSTTIQLVSPSLSGYRFMGWYTNSSFGEENKITCIKNGSIGNITLYARWEKLYTATFKHGTQTQTITGIYGEKIIVPDLSAAYIYVSGDVRKGASELYEIKGDITFVSEDKTIYECFNSETNVYEIYTYSQLSSISSTNTVNNTYVIMNDIRMSVSNVLHIASFKGVLDGRGHVLKYVRSVVYSSQSSGNFGLIKYNSGTVKDLTIDGLSVTVQASDSTLFAYAGMAVGCNEGIIDGVTVKNCEIIAGRSYVSVGGIAGYNSGTIRNCSVNTLTFDGCGDMGGIAGTSTGGTIEDCSASSCEFTFRLDGVNRSVGGIVAYANQSSVIDSCSVSSVSMTFDTYTNLELSEVQPKMGYVIGNLTDSTATNITATNCSIDSGDLPERTGTIFKYYYPCKYIKGFSNGKIGYASGSTYP